jgi:hypothetical protein
MTNKVIVRQVPFDGQFACVDLEFDDMESAQEFIDLAKINMAGDFMYYLIPSDDE